MPTPEIRSGARDAGTDGTSRLDSTAAPLVHRGWSARAWQFERSPAGGCARVAGADEVRTRALAAVVAAAVVLGDGFDRRESRLQALTERQGTIRLPHRSGPLRWRRVVVIGGDRPPPLLRATHLAILAPWRRYRPVPDRSSRRLRCPFPSLSGRSQGDALSSPSRASTWQSRADAIWRLGRTLPGYDGRTHGVRERGTSGRRIGVGPSAFTPLLPGLMQRWLF